MGNTTKSWQIEDAALKTTMQFFADELLPYFNIKGKVVGFGPTELVRLELQKLFQDFNLVMEDGSWKHFEFQSKDGGEKDLRRFRTYEAATSYQQNVDIYTYVLFSGQIENPITELKTGFNTYRVQPIIMKGKRVEEAFDITKAARETIPEADKIEAVVYAMAEKFMDSVTIEQLKEAVGMTRLGQMMYNDGVETTQIKIAKNLLGEMPDEKIAEKTGLPLETIKELYKEK